MGKSVGDNVLDNGLSYVRWNANRFCVCSAEPTTVAMAVSTEMLAWYSCTSTDFSIANGSVSGRRIIMASAISFAVSVTGSAQHVAVVGVVGAAPSLVSYLMLVTTCTNQTVTAGNTLTIPEWDYEIADPT